MANSQSWWCTTVAVRIKRGISSCTYCLNGMERKSTAFIFKYLKMNLVHRKRKMSITCWTCPKLRILIILVFPMQTTSLGPTIFPRVFIALRCMTAILCKVNGPSEILRTAFLPASSPWSSPKCTTLVTKAGRRASTWVFWGALMAYGNLRSFEKLCLTKRC